MKKALQALLFVIIIVLAFVGKVSSPLALILGFLFTLSLGNPFPEYSKKAIQYFLKLSVIGLGFGMSVLETIQISKDGFLITALSILLTISLGLLFIKLFNIEKKLGFLIASGTSICGGSAIAAISPVIDADHKTISMSIGVIFLLNSIALLIFPTLGHFFDLTKTQFGVWAAIAIHDTSSVVGAALEYGNKALQVATTVKLARTLWIIPLSFFAILLFKTKTQKVKIPFFILGFIIAMILNSYHVVPEVVSTSIVSFSKKLLIVTLFLVGANLTISDLKNTGLKPLFFSVLLWIIISAFSLIFILNF